MEIKNGRDKVAYYCSYFNNLQGVAEEEDYYSSNGTSYDPEAVNDYDSYLQYRSLLSKEMIDIVRSGEDIVESKFSNELKGLIQRVRDKAPKEFLEEFPNG
ncbi:MAG: hypothetical protein EBS38_01325 [Actinobacteria bacterium]|nr:hypothetical protein [Actinomycetota bacterium]